MHENHIENFDFTQDMTVYNKTHNVIDLGLLFPMAVLDISCEVLANTLLKVPPLKLPVCAWKY